MAGKMCTGAQTGNAANPSQSRAFCEGMAFRASGDYVPKTENPHEANSEDALAWIRGWDLANVYTGQEVPIDQLGCCAAVPQVPVIPV